MFALLWSCFMYRISAYALTLLLLACGQEEEVVDSDLDGFTEGFDCDDTNAAINPNADELCDGVDNNCDGLIDDTTAIDLRTWFADADGDGFGDAENSVDACDAVDGFVSDNTDCDDTNQDLRPDDRDGDSFSTCDGDCNDDDATLRPDDRDGDGYSSCDGDCDDLDFERSPEDRDGDGYTGCDGDCDDADSTRFLADESIQNTTNRYDEGKDGTYEWLYEQQVIRDVDEQTTEDTYTYDSDNDGSDDYSGRTEYTYDAKGNISTELQQSDNLNDKTTNRSRTTYTYDADDNVIRRVVDYDPNGAGKWVGYAHTDTTYNAAGSILTQDMVADYNGDGTIDTNSYREYTYDGRGNRISEHIDFDRDGKVDQSYTYTLTYNSSGNISRNLTQLDYTGDGVANSKWADEYTYDTRDNVLTKSYLLFSCGTCKDIVQRNQTVYTYDADDNETSSIQTYDYDNDGKVDYSFDTYQTFNSTRDILTRMTEADYDGDGILDEITNYAVEYTANFYISREEFSFDLNADASIDGYQLLESEYTWMCP